MSDKNNLLVDAEKISILEFKIVKGQVDTPEDFDQNKVEGYQLDNCLQFAYNLDDKLVKTDFTIEIKTKSKGQHQPESVGNFHLVFIFRIENLAELATLDKNKLIELPPFLGNALSSITYSTARGILLTRFQGTALQDFILPIINPNTLLYNKE